MISRGKQILRLALQERNKTQENHISTSEKRENKEELYSENRCPSAREILHTLDSSAASLPDNIESSLPDDITHDLINLFPIISEKHFQNIDYDIVATRLDANRSFTIFNTGELDGQVIVADDENKINEN